jgi:ATP-binding cassette subfamily D (ALD) long-chain fatty acid import protein
LDRHRRFFPPVSSSTKIGVNSLFFRQLKSLFLILFPSKRCKEAGLIFLHTFFLILRTYLSVVVARLDGRLVKDLVAHFTC